MTGLETNPATTLGNAPSMGQKFFISFNSGDQTKAHWIAWTLKEAGHEVAVHDWEIPAGGNAPAWMSNKLAWADRLIAVVSPDYVPARYSPMEWTWASKSPSFLPDELTMRCA